jgi:LMBR1 domain-containing protein 1
MCAILQEATDLAKRSKDIRDVAVALQREERSGNKGRNWRKNVRRVERVGQRNPT